MIGLQTAHPVHAHTERCALAEINVAVHRVNCVRPIRERVYDGESVGEREKGSRGRARKRDTRKRGCEEERVTERIGGVMTVEEEEVQDGGEARKVYIHHFVFLADIKIYTIVQTAHPPSAPPPHPFDRPTFRHPPASSKPTLFPPR